MKKTAKKKTKDDSIEFGNSAMINMQRDSKIKSVHDLSFVSKDGPGVGKWWDPTLPKTEYWSVHRELGRAYGYELLDLWHNPDAEVSASQIGRMCQEAGRYGPAVSVADGFFEILGEYLVNGDVSR